MNEEEYIWLAIEELEKAQDGEFACEENVDALALLRIALNKLNGDRTHQNRHKYKIES